MVITVITFLKYVVMIWKHNYPYKVTSDGSTNSVDVIVTKKYK